MKRPIFLLLVFLSVMAAEAQTRKKPTNFNKNSGKKDKFLEKQWWLGFKAGVNLTEANPTTRYTVLTPTNYAPALNEKAYDNFNKLGSQASLEATFYYKGFSFSFQPTYRHIRFTYANEFNWDNPENATERLLLNYNHEQKIDYADFPLAVKYDLTGSRLRPYVQLGIFYSRLINANKSVKVSGQDFASGGTNEFSNEPVIVGAKDLFNKSYWGLSGGVGLNYNLGNVRLILDISYQLGMSNIANTKNRFGNDRLSGIGDVQDDLKINNIVISTGVLFPMRFLSNSFKTLDH